MRMQTLLRNLLTRSLSRGTTRRPLDLRMRVRPHLELLECRLAPTISIINNFDALVTDRHAEPPDTVGAAGPNSYIETVNSSAGASNGVAIYNKATGAVIAQDNLQHFFYTTGGITPTDSSSGLSDVTMCYDEPIGRFIVGDLDVDQSTPASSFDFAVSRNSNPTALDTNNWRFYQLSTTEPGLWSDYPGNIGYNQDALVITWYMSASGKNVGPIRVDAESQADLANNSAGSISGVTFNLSAPLLRPVTMHDSTAGGPMWLVQASQGSGSSVTLIRVDNILNAGSVTTTPFTVPVASYSAPNPALNPNGTPIVSPFGGGQTDARILKAAEANNIIVASQTIGINSNEDGARWYEFNVSDINNPTLADEGTEHFGANTYATYSGIDINPVGDIGMSLILSGNDTSTDYMSVVVTGRNSSDPAGRMEDPAILVRAGDSNNTDGRMGDFSGINVDPDGSFWIANEFTTGGSGATEVVHFALSNNGEAFVKNGILEVTGTNSDDNVALQPNPNNSGQTEVLDNGVDLGDFNNGTFSSINVDTFGGNDSLDITDNGGSSGLDFYDGVPVTYDGGTGTNSVLLDDSTANFSDTYTITNNSVSRPFFGGLTYSNVASLTLDAETGNNTIDINSTGAAVTINDDAGSDTVNLSDGVQANGLDNLPGPVTVNGGGSDVVNLNDQSATFSDTYTITSNTVSRPFFGGLTYSGLAGLTLNAETGNNTININSTAFGTPVTINDDAGSDTVNLSDGVQANGLDNLPGPVTVNGGGSDVVNLNDQSATFSDTYTITSNAVSRPFFGGLTYSGLAGLTLNAETGNNTININSTASGTPVTINDDAGSDTVNVGNGDLNAVAGAVTVNGSGGTALVNVNDQSNASVNSYAVTSSTVGRAGFAGLTYNGIAGLTINGGTAADTYSLNSTASGTPVTANGGASNDTFKLTAGNLDSLAGAVTVNGGGGSNTVNVNDQTNTGTQTYVVTDSTVTRGPTFGGLTYGTVQTLVLNGGSGADIYNIQGTASGTATTVKGGAASDTFDVGSTINTLDAILGALTIKGNGGTNVLQLFDQGNAVGQTFTLSPTLITRSGGVSITYGTMISLGIQAGTGNDSMTVNAAPTITTTVDLGGGTNTLQGPNATNTWTIGSANHGTLGTNLTFSNAQNLTGGTGADTFKFSGAGAKISGSLSGGGGKSDKLDYSADGGVAISVNLQTGVASRIGGTISGISSLVGSTVATDTLTAANATNAWSITGLDAGKVDTFSYTGIEKLVGGTGVDTFKFGAAGGETHINGGGTPVGQGDWLDYSLLTTAVTVNLATGSATDVSGGISNIQNVISGTGVATLTGDSHGNILIGHGAADTINGGTGRSLLIGGTGASTINGGSGGDIMIGGKTSYDTANHTALMAILAEWQSADAYAVRTDAITDGTIPGGYKLSTASTVTLNSAATAEQLIGHASASQLDWFFASASSQHSALEAGEIVNNDPN
jgi:hypothetical protein